MSKVQLTGIAVFAAILFLSFAGGTFPFGATSAPGDVGSCGQTGCHGGGTFEITGGATLLSPDGEETNRYAPGTEYTMSMKFEATGLPTGWGFQMVCLDDTEGPVNNFKDLPDGVQETVLLSRQYLSHTQTLPVADLEIPWTAPDVASVNCFIAVNAVDGSANPQGDLYMDFSVELTRGGTSTDQVETNLFQAYPNPAQDRLYIDGEGALSRVELMNLQGARLIDQHDQQAASLDISMLQSGTYLLRMTDITGKLQVEKVVKL